jgi:hypothetical protein
MAQAVVILATVAVLSTRFDDPLHQSRGAEWVGLGVRVLLAIVTWFLVLAPPEAMAGIVLLRTSGVRRDLATVSRRMKSR